MNNRAYSLIDIKAFDGDKRTFTGIASTPVTDRMGDIVEPKGAQFKLPIPLLWQHDSNQPIGWVTDAKVTSRGIEIAGEVADIPEDGNLKERLTEAWQSIKNKLVRGLSIGFRPLETEQIQGSWGVRFLSWEWLELSAVTVAANSDASIQNIKSIDTKLRAASGQTEHRVVRLTTPGASGKTTGEKSPSSNIKPPEGDMNTQEQIKSFEDKRKSNSAEMDTIMAKAADSGETLDAEQSEKYDTLKGENVTIDKHLDRLREHEKSLVATAKRVDNVTTQTEASTVRGHDGVIAVAKKLAPGIAFARFAGMAALAHGNMREASEIAKDIFPEEKHLPAMLKMFAGRNPEEVVKNAVAAGTALDSTWAAPLVQYQQMADEFIEFLRPQTIIGNIPGLRRVPFNIRVPRQTAGGGAGWVGEGLPKGVTKLAFDSVTLQWTKIATISVISEELARFSSPSAETIVRDQLAKAIVQQMDVDFVDPENAGTANVKPASITNGVTRVASSGGSEDDVRTDIKALFAPFIAANLTPANGVWIMSATTALSLSLMVNTLGQPSFPGITMRGGTFWGMPVVVSEAAGVVGDSAGGHIVILANANDILLADDGQVTVDASREASLQMLDNPTNSPIGSTTATAMVSMWQTNSIAIRAERYINWTKARAQSVQYLYGVDWGTGT